MAKRTKEEFIERAKKIHGDKYDYSKVEYINSKTKVCIICPKHGEFWQEPTSHLMGVGCPKCAIRSRAEKIANTKEQFIEEAHKVHGDKYDYSKVVYINSVTKVCIICPEHGEFWVRPSDHIHCHIGCHKCSGCYKNTREEFIEKARKKYGDKYDYNKVVYKNNKTKVCIICHEKDQFGIEHGEFWQRPNDHLTGYECPKCKNQYKPTTEEWITRARNVHGDKYDYSKVKYISARKKVCIICPIHGEFWQEPSNHVNGANCPNCNSDNKSKMEENIHLLLEKHEIKHERQKTFPWLKYKRNLFLDFYIPYKKVAIEVQGDQHYVPIRKFGGLEYFQVQQERDKMKKQLCEEHGIKLFYITKKNYNLNEVLKYIKK